MNSASIRGTFSEFFHAFSVYFFGIDFRIVSFFDFVRIWELPGHPVGRAFARAVQHRTPGDTPMVGTRGPGDAGDGLRARRQRLLVIPWADPISHHQFHRFSTNSGVDFSCFSNDFLYKFPPIELNIVFYRMYLPFLKNYFNVILLGKNQEIEEHRSRVHFR